jgi:hypothetical protein
MPVQTQIQQRRGTAASWTSTNPTLAAGEIGFESDTNRFKIGTGSTAWASLSYWVQDPVTTKGDLYTFSTTDARLAVGANGETLVADSSATSGLRYQGNYAAGKNKIINGDFGIWQRGTSVSPASLYGYTADRWRTYSWGSSTSTVTRQTFTPGTAPVAGYEGQYFLRVNSTNTGTFVGQPIEDVRTFAGQTVTVSFWAKAASAVSATATIAFDQNFGSGGSSTVNTAIATSQSFTTSWVRYSYTGTLPSISGKTIGTNSFLDLTISLGQINNAFDIWGVQLEAGSVATAFQTATGTIQGELAACQRYYWRTTADDNGDWIAGGMANSTTEIAALVQFPQTMRRSATSMDVNGIGWVVPSVADYSFSGANFTSTTTNTARLNLTGGTGLTANRPGFVTLQNVGSFIGFSAEL